MSKSKQGMSFIPSVVQALLLGLTWFLLAERMSWYFVQVNLYVFVLSAFTFAALLAGYSD